MEISDELRERLMVDRLERGVLISLPADVTSDLEVVAELLGFSSAEALVRSYVGRGLRGDMSDLFHGGIARDSSVTGTGGVFVPDEVVERAVWLMDSMQDDAHVSVEQADAISVLLAALRRPRRAMTTMPPGSDG